jgi:hypothetical protein
MKPPWHRLLICAFLCLFLASLAGCVRNGLHRHDPSDRPDSSEHDYPTRTEVPPVKIKYEIP